MSYQSTALSGCIDNEWACDFLSTHFPHFLNFTVGLTGFFYCLCGWLLKVWLNETNSIYIKPMLRLYLLLFASYYVKSNSAHVKHILVSSFLLKDPSFFELCTYLFLATLNWCANVKFKYKMASFPDSNLWLRWFRSGRTFNGSAGLRQSLKQREERHSNTSIYPMPWMWYKNNW